MTLAPSEETKPAFTPEQRQVLGRVYSYLMDIARKRSFRQEPVDHARVLQNNKQPCNQEDDEASTIPKKDTEYSSS